MTNAGRAPIVALIPARKGSQRLVNKNMHPFHGRPLAGWTLDYARDAKALDRIIVSTDDEELIALVERDYGDRRLVVSRRPENLAGATATVLQVMRRTIDEFELADDAVMVLLQVTAPLRVASDLDEALRLFEADGRSRTVVSVSESTYPPALLWRMGADGALEPWLPNFAPAVTRKQDHEPTYFWNDVVLLDSVANLRVRDRNLFGERPIPLLVPRERGIGIDYPIQFRMAEVLFPPIDERKGTLTR